MESSLAFLDIVRRQGVVLYKLDTLLVSVPAG